MELETNSNKSACVLEPHSDEKLRFGEDSGTETSHIETPEFIYQTFDR